MMADLDVIGNVNTDINKNLREHTKRLEAPLQLTPFLIVFMSFLLPFTSCVNGAWLEAAPVIWLLCCCLVLVGTVVGFLMVHLGADAA